MPTLEISHKDLCKLIGKPLSIKSLEEKEILYAKGEIEEARGDSLKIDIKDTNRPDLWSAEGIAREIKGRHGSGFPAYETRKSGIVVNVDRSVALVRPRTVAAVVRNLNLSKEALSQLIQLQEKVAMTFGRNRREVAIGVYDLSRLKPPISYTTIPPTGIRFVPLGSSIPMSLKDILENHPKGKEFGHLLKGKKLYPIFIDSKKEVLSLPPIINSNSSGRVTEETRDVFIECSGFDYRFLIPSLNVLAAALADRGGSIEQVDIAYPRGKIRTPDLRPKKASISPDYINKVSGLSLNNQEILSLLRQALYKPSVQGGKIHLLYPAYRQDIMHARDIVEDIIISYGYNDTVPASPQIATLGSMDPLEKATEKVAEVLIGLGLQEVMSYTLTSKESFFKMNIPQEACEISNPMSANWSVFRTMLMPSLLSFLSKNKHVEYPQKVFEIGDCVALEPKAETRTRNSRNIAVLVTGNKASFEDASSLLAALMDSLGIHYSLQPSSSPSYLQGRVAEVIVKNRYTGVVGELHPQILNDWSLEKPVAGFELSMDGLL